MTEPARRPDRQGWALRRLLEIHDGLRNDLARLRRAVVAVTEDGQDVGTAAPPSAGCRSGGRDGRCGGSAPASARPCTVTPARATRPDVVVMDTRMPLLDRI